jgi:hypothetical protein
MPFLRTLIVTSILVVLHTLPVSARAAGLRSESFTVRGVKIHYLIFSSRNSARKS